MNTIDKLPREIREVEHVEISLSDGCRLAARIWRPADAVAKPCPAILEYLPYRKNDLTASRDAPMHRYVAGHGYACVRVDLRGAGDSEGVLRDEYLQQELDDGVEVIEWLARQPWCDGNVGMYGISWGGFNGLQIAAMAPPALKAIVSCSSTVDRFNDDIHYMGGCLLLDNVSWASEMFAFNSCPPDPRNVGPRWRDMWLQRLRESGLWLEPWLEHQHRDAYWRHGSVCEDFRSIRCPVFAVSGWADGYCNTVFRLLEGLRVPRKGLVGPWAHTYPHIGRPGPAIGFLQECIRWWDQWLRGIDTGVMDEPMLRAWIQDSAPPQSHYETRPGRWVAETAWPSSSVHTIVRPLGNGGRLLPAGEDAPETMVTLASPLAAGMHAGKWCSYAQPGDQPSDQRFDDACSLTFDTDVLAQDMEILGQPVLEVDLESDSPVAMLAVRINEVDPTGEVTRVTYGLLNLTHRDGNEHPEPLVPGRRYRVRVPCKHVGQRFCAGNRLRLSISTSYWPLAWPSPEPATVSIHLASSHLQLPLRSPRPEDRRLPPFGAAEAGEPLARVQIEPARCHWQIHEDLADDSRVLDIVDGAGTFEFSGNGLRVTRHGHEQYRSRGNDYTSPCVDIHREMGFERADWKVRTVTDLKVQSDGGTFAVDASLKAYEDGTLAYEQQWHRQIPRRLV